MGSTIKAWVQAARPLAQVNIALPLLVGQLLGFAVTGAWSWWLFIATHVAGVVDQLFIVFANDVADEEGDRANTTFNAFSGGSRVIVDGKIEPRQLLRAAIAMAFILIGVAGATAAGFDRPMLLPAWAAGIALLWAYSFAPLRLSYRGLGELAQGVGLGVVLPLIGFYAQAGSLDAFPWPALGPLFLVGFAGNITTALPDRPADEAVDKRTWPVRFGDARARKHSLQFLALAVFATPWVVPSTDRWIWAAIEAGPAVLLALNLRAIRRADPEDRAGCRRFVFINGLALNVLLLGWAIALGLRLADF